MSHPVCFYRFLLSVRFFRWFNFLFICALFSLPEFVDCATSFDFQIKSDTTVLPAASKTADPKAAQPDSTAAPCIDLIVDSVSVLSLTSGSVTLQYFIRNIGTAPAPLNGDGALVKEKVAVQFFFSGSNRITRGSIFAHSAFVSADALKETKGVLAPGKAVRQTAKFSLENKPRFYKVILIEIDALNAIENECDETNNVSGIVPKW